MSDKDRFASRLLLKPQLDTTGLFSHNASFRAALCSVTYNRFRCSAVKLLCSLSVIFQRYCWNTCYLWEKYTHRQQILWGAHRDPHQRRPKDASHDGLHYIWTAEHVRKTTASFVLGRMPTETSVCLTVCESSLLFGGKAEVLWHCCTASKSALGGGPGGWVGGFWKAQTENT